MNFRPGSLVKPKSYGSAGLFDPYDMTNVNNELADEEELLSRVVTVLAVVRKRRGTSALDTYCNTHMLLLLCDSTIGWDADEDWELL